MLRVRGIPQSWDASQLQSFLQDQVGLQGVVVESLAPEASTNSLLASIAFQDLPKTLGALRPGSGVQLLLPKQSEDDEDRHLTLDVNFVGCELVAETQNFSSSHTDLRSRRSPCQKPKLCWSIQHLGSANAAVGVRPG